MSQLLQVQPAVASYVLETALEGATYRLTIRWNDRDAAWYMHLADVDDAPIVSGVKLVADWPLLRRVIDSRRPPGELYVVDTQGEGDAPTFASLGARHLLVYLTAAEAAALAAEVAAGG